MIQHVNGVDLWFEKTGAGQPILLLHGNGESHIIFGVLTKQLAKNYTVYALDSRDHGQSSKTKALSYNLMVEDILQFINALQLQKPILYGFSDGGIIGLLLASRYPTLLSKLVVSGANTTPNGTRKSWNLLFHIIYLFSRSRKYKLMLTEPHISAQELNKINIPVLILAGQRDIIKEEDTRFIAGNISGSVLKILNNENHMSYVINNPRLYHEMEAFLAEGAENSTFRD